MRKERGGERARAQSTRTKGERGRAGQAGRVRRVEGAGGRAGERRERAITERLRDASAAQSVGGARVRVQIRAPHQKLLRAFVFACLCARTQTASFAHFNDVGASYGKHFGGGA